MDMINIGLVGYGRTGKVVADEIYRQEDVILSSVFKKTQDELIGGDIGELHGKISNGNRIRHISELEDCLKQGLFDVIIDFAQVVDRTLHKAAGKINSSIIILLIEPVKCKNFIPIHTAYIDLIKSLKRYNTCTSP